MNRKVYKIKSKYRRWMLIPRVKVKKMYWEFHKGDADYNPSVPHGHSKDGKYKLELWSGKIYEDNRLVGYAKKKEMDALKKVKGFLEFVDECRQIYQERHPTITLKPLEQAKVHRGMHQQKNRVRLNTNDSYIVCIDCKLI